MTRQSKNQTLFEFLHDSNEFESLILDYKIKGNATPFLKWAGGKGQLLDKINKKLPETIIKSKKNQSYVEPFVGGGAVFFFLKNNFDIKETVIIDNNIELIIGFQVIKKNPSGLINKLKELEILYLKKSEPERKKFYYKQREAYNNQMSNFDYEEYNSDWIERVVYLIFLNKTCFNGLFRQNKKGEFNVPFGRYSNPSICNWKNILEVHKALQKTVILCGDFSDSKKYIKKNSFVYFDPPYRPLSATSNFTDYSKSSFNDDEQIRLANFFKEMDKRGAYLMLSNSDPKNEVANDDFFDDLYREFNIERVKAKRAISCKGTGRGEITELLIRNYK